MELNCSAACSQLKKEHGIRFKINTTKNHYHFLKKISYILNLSSGLPVPVGVHAACVTIGETVGEIRPAGDDLSGNRGLVILPRLQSRKQPFRMGLDEN